MKRSWTTIFLAVLLVSCKPAIGARNAVEPIKNPPITVYQAYLSEANGWNIEFNGYAGLGNANLHAVPGILAIEPGKPNWANFVRAERDKWPGGWRIQNVILKKEVPEGPPCVELFPNRIVQQQGTPNIRLWWPLLYEVPGTKWTLIIQYSTGAIPDPNNPGKYLHYDDDGVGPNPPSPIHQEIWEWNMSTDVASMSRLLELFHSLPFGKDEVPLISDEDLYPLLQQKLRDLQANLSPGGDLLTASQILWEFEMELVDRCITASPTLPYPRGTGTGVANTEENPACCKLLADAEYIGYKYGIFQSGR